MRTIPRALGAPRQRGLISRCALQSVVVGVVGLVGLVGLGGCAPPAQALVPRAHRIIAAVADANVSGHRVRALRFKLTLRIGAGPPVAVGELVSHPTGLARLELRTTGGLVERHILLGDQHSASRNARLLVRPRAFLPPLFVLQSDSRVVLEAALGTLGVDRKLVGLAPCGDNDCYVIGDPTRAVRRPPARAKAELQTQPEGTDPDETQNPEPGEASGDDSAAQPGEPGEEDATAEAAEPRAGEFFATLWVDTVDHTIHRVDSRDGVRVILGPYASFERLRVPKWWSIEEPGKRPVRFDVEAVIEVNAPAAAFSKSWLMAPVAEAPPAADAPASTNTPPLPPDL